MGRQAVAAGDGSLPDAARLCGLGGTMGGGWGNVLGWVLPDDAYDNPGGAITVIAD